MSFLILIVCTNCSVVSKMDALSKCENKGKIIIFSFLSQLCVFHYCPLKGIQNIFIYNSLAEMNSSSTVSIISLSGTLFHPRQTYERKFCRTHRRKVSVMIWLYQSHILDQYKQFISAVICTKIMQRESQTLSNALVFRLRLIQCDGMISYHSSCIKKLFFRHKYSNKNCTSSVTH